LRSKDTQVLSSAQLTACQLPNPSHGPSSTWTMTSYKNLSIGHLFLELLPTRPEHLQTTFPTQRTLAFTRVAFPAGFRTDASLFTTLRV
jgi:hypothetical protein